jgi:hypothetical protein
LKCQNILTWPKRVLTTALLASEAVNSSSLTLESELAAGVSCLLFHSVFHLNVHVDRSNLLPSPLHEPLNVPDGAVRNCKNREGMYWFEDTSVSNEILSIPLSYIQMHEDLAPGGRLGQHAPQVCQLVADSPRMLHELLFSCSSQRALSSNGPYFDLL